MSNSSITIQVPGKLMIAGEFAVLEPYHKLIAMAVNRFVYVDIHANKTNQLTLEKFNLRNLNWNFVDKQVIIDSTDTRVNFVQEAMTIAFGYLSEKNISIDNFSLQVKSELDDKVSGKKFGLGSSAAVAVGVITAILQYHLPKAPSPLLVFKLAAISHVAAQGNGSGADVAASAFGGIIQYSSFQANWLRNRYNESNTLLEVIEMDWPYLSIEPVALPADIHLRVGWTGSPASTGNLVNQILQLKNTKRDKYEEFLHNSEEAVKNILRGMLDNDLPLLLSGVKQNRTALVAVGKEAETDLETTKIAKLCDLAEELGGAAKQSGAGGGDCGIAMMPSIESAEMLVHTWKDEGITPLELKSYPLGAISL
ncbi:phosphomevalonate kinase [Ornithinibacillus sp. 179-J 7C1 HS]|uniref:phosphomevalonate kinase n=1 Tax=Ornithinibacillus sp. 179-J 7C1 HS TaxID=3142384 RepID=UPI0039A2CB84